MPSLSSNRAPGRGIRNGAPDRGGLAVRAAVFGGPHRIEIGDRPDRVVEAPTDAVVRVVLGSAVKLVRVQTG
jgi:hypothetical protein